MFLNVGSIQRVTLVWLVQMMRVMTMDQSGLKQPRRQQGSQGPPKAAQCQPRYDLLRSILCLPSMPFSAPYVSLICPAFASLPPAMILAYIPTVADKPSIVYPLTPLLLRSVTHMQMMCAVERIWQRAACV